MAKPVKKYTTDHNRPSVWNQRTDDIGKSDAATNKIFAQMTGDGIISTEQKKKGNNRRV